MHSHRLPLSVFLLIAIYFGVQVNYPLSWAWEYIYIYDDYEENFNGSMSALAVAKMVNYHIYIKHSWLQQFILLELKGFLIG